MKFTLNNPVSYSLLLAMREWLVANLGKHEIFDWYGPGWRMTADDHVAWTITISDKQTATEFALRFL